jgi:RNA polymerase sigma-70 factor (ECF subfamily)
VAQRLLELFTPFERINNSFSGSFSRMTLLNDQSDGELLESLSRGNEDALATLYHRRQGAIYRFALQMSGSHALAEDVTQEVFMVLIRGKAGYDPAKGSVNAFMLGIASNHVLRRLHHQQALVSLDVESEESFPVTGQDGPLDLLSRGEAIGLVRKAVLTLPEHYREVVILCELQEMGYAEAATVLGCAIGTVRSRLHRARSLLLEKLRPIANDEKSSRAEAGSARCFA